MQRNDVEIGRIVTQSGVEKDVAKIIAIPTSIRVSSTDFKGELKLVRAELAESYERFCKEFAEELASLNDTKMKSIGKDGRAYSVHVHFRKLRQSAFMDRFDVLQYAVRCFSARELQLVESDGLEQVEMLIKSEDLIIG